MLGLVRIVANRTDVIGHEPCRGLVPFDVTETKGDSPVMADVSCGGQRAVGETIDHYALIEKCHGMRSAGDFVRESNRVPEWRKNSPIGFAERAPAREDPLMQRFR